MAYGSTITSWYIKIAFEASAIYGCQWQNRMQVK